MNVWKKIGNALLFPPIAILILLIPISAVLLVYAFVFLKAQGVGNYIIYAVSAYTVTVLCFRIPHIVRLCKRLQEKNRMIARWTADTRFRINLTLFGSLLWNMAYALFQLGLGFKHATVWYYSFAAYYAILAVMRFFLFRYTKSYAPGEQMRMELRRYRLCGILLAVMNLSLGVIVGYITWQNRTFVHHQITTITMAAYTFTALTVAIVNLVKYRRHGSPVFSAAKAISFAAALVSLLTLETTMLTVFGDGSGDGFRQMMLGMTGAGVLLAILAMSVVMIVRSTGQLKHRRVNENRERTR